MGQFFQKTEQNNCLLKKGNSSDHRIPSKKGPLRSPKLRRASGPSGSPGAPTTQLEDMESTQESYVGENCLLQKQRSFLAQGHTFSPRNGTNRSSTCGRRGQALPALQQQVVRPQRPSGRAWSLAP
ncbi:hypothetical protein VULLAG_LOCUS13184 [Vulpes lagopus]